MWLHLVFIAFFGYSVLQYPEQLTSHLLLAPLPNSDSFDSQLGCHLLQEALPDTWHHSCLGVHPLSLSGCGFSNTGVGLVCLPLSPGAQYKSSSGLGMGVPCSPSPLPNSIDQHGPCIVSQCAGLRPRASEPEGGCHPMRLMGRAGVCRSLTAPSASSLPTPDPGPQAWARPVPLRRSSTRTSCSAASGSERSWSREARHAGG